MKMHVHFKNMKERREHDNDISKSYNTYKLCVVRETIWTLHNIHFIETVYVKVYGIKRIYEMIMFPILSKRKKYAAKDAIRSFT